MSIFDSYYNKSKKEGKDLELIQSSTTPDPANQWESDNFTITNLDITNESKEVSPFQAGDHKASINRCRRKHNENKTELTEMIHKEAPPWSGQ